MFLLWPNVLRGNTLSSHEYAERNLYNIRKDVSAEAERTAGKHPHGCCTGSPAGETPCRTLSSKKHPHGCCTILEVWIFACRINRPKGERRISMQMGSF